MSKLRSWLRSELTNSVETKAILHKIAFLFSQKSSRVVFAKGNDIRINASLCGDVMIDETLTHNNIQFARPPLATGQEQTEVICFGDTGKFERADITALADTGVKGSTLLNVTNTAAASQADYFVFANVAGTKWAVWLDIDANGTPPTGADFLSVISGNRLKASVVTGGTAIQNAAAVRTAIASHATNMTITDNLDGTITFDQNKMGPFTSITGHTHNANDSAIGSFTVVSGVVGVASNLNSKYFTFQPIQDSHGHYVWFNVNSEGVDPAPAGHDTGHAIALSPSASANTVAAAIRTVFGTLSFAVEDGGTGAHAKLKDDHLGPMVESVTDGTAATGFTIVTTAGAASNLSSTYFTMFSANDATEYYVWLNIDGAGTDPAVGGATGIEVDSVGESSASAIATAIAGAVNGGDFTATADGSTVTITNVGVGEATDTADGGAPTDFTFIKLGELEAYDTADIQIIRRLRTKKYLIRIKADADPAFIS